MDVRSARAAQRTLQFEPAWRHLPGISSEFVRRHDQPTSPWLGNRPTAGGMAPGFRARRGGHRKPGERPCGGASDHRAALGARALAARRFLAGWHPPGPRARRVYEVVCQKLRCSRVTHGPGNMRILELTLHEVRMKLVTPFETSMDRTNVRRFLLVQANVDGVIGWGECVAGETPYYSPETADTAWLILRDFLWPLIKGKDFACASDVWDLFGRVRGHNMAKAALEAAVWDAEAKQKGVPLSKLIGGVRQEIACGVSIGIKESLDELAATVQKELAAGYQRIKIKIKPGKDLEPVRRLRQDFPRIKLMVDANSAYTLNDSPLLEQLEGFYLMMIEQPLGWDDLYSHVELQKKLETPICLDECIHTEEQARAAVELGACKIIN